MSNETKMAFEGLLYYGAAGSTAGNLLVNVTEATIKIGKSTGDTTSRGNGSGPPVHTERVTEIIPGLEFSMLNRSDDTYLAAMLAAAAAGTPVALRGKDYAAGKGPDMDYILEADNGEPKNGEQTYKFTATPTRDGGRTPTTADVYK